MVVATAIQERFDDFLLPAIAIAAFLVVWQLFCWLPGATLPGPIKVV